MKTRGEWFRRYLVFLIGLTIMALAVAVMSKAALGISPVQSLCYVIYRRFPDHISLGTLIFCWNCTLLLLQIPLRCKQFQWNNLLQIPFSLFLGRMVDLFGTLLRFFVIDSFPLRILLMLCGVVLLAFSISITVAAKTIMNTGEALVAAIADRTNRPFATVKVLNDLTLISIAIIASFVLFGKWNYDIVGVGTLTSATLTGILVGQFQRFVVPLVDHICNSGLSHKP